MQEGRASRQPQGRAEAAPMDSDRKLLMVPRLLVLPGWVRQARQGPTGLEALEPESKCA